MACRSVGTKAKGSWDQEVSEVDVLDIVETFKLIDLDDVFIRLGLKEKDREDAKLIDPHNPKKRAKKLLNLWRNRNGKQATRIGFMEAVKNCPDCKGSMDKLKAKWNISPSEPKRRKPEETHPVINTPYDDFDLEKCQKKLKEIYKNRRGGISFLPGFPKKLSSDEFFVDLKLLKEQYTPTKVKYIKLKTYTDLLKIHDSMGKCLDHVLVSGLAGTGKTTLVSRLAYQWANINTDNTPQASRMTNHQSSQPLCRFQLVFTLDIRKFKPDSDLVDAIQNQLLQHVSKQALESYLFANADKCLFLFDGYDELGLDEIVLNSNMLCGAHVILTTRPNTVEEFYDKHRESRYIQVQLKGFSKESAAQFVKKFFGQSLDQGNEATGLLQTINGKSFLKSFSQFPLLLAMMCLLWKDQRCLPTSITSLYHQLMEYLAKHSGTRIPTHKSSYKEGMPIPSFGTTYTSCKQLLILLGKTGFEGLMDKNSKLIFREDEFDAIDAVEYGCLLGLLTKNSRVVGFDQVTEISFIHKTFQEFSAAVYLCSVGDGNAQLKAYLSQIKIDDMENVLRFCCGEDAGSVVKDILKHVVDLSCDSKQQMQKKGMEFGIGRDSPDPWALPLTLLYEAESQFGFTESLHNLFEPLVSHINLVNKCFLLDGVDGDYLIVLEHYISESKTHDNWLRFVREAIVYWYDGNLARHVGMMMTQMPQLSTLIIAQVSSYGYLSDCSHFINAIQDKITGRLLRMLDFYSCTCDIVVLNKFLVTQPNLTILSIPLQKGKHFTDIEAQALGQVLDELHSRSGSMKMLSVMGRDMSRFIRNIRASWNTLEKLELIEVHMTMNNWQELFESIIDAGQASQRNTNQECDNDVSNSAIAALPLKYLDLRESLIGDSSFKLADAMKYISSLEYLGLKSNNLDDSHFNEIGPAINYLSNLTELDLLHNRIGNSFEAIIHGINNCKLMCLDISSSSIKLDDASNNAMSSMRLPTVHRLKLCSSYITSHGAKVLSESLPYMTVLETIILTENNIGSDGVRALSASFQHIPQLSELYFSHNNIGSDGAKALSASFQHIPQLSWLDLSHNNIESDGAIALSASFQHIRQLSSLVLSHSNIGSNGAIALSASFQHIPQLTVLELSHNNIGSGGARALSASFHHLPYLDMLAFNNNPIGPDGVEEIFRNLHHLPKMMHLNLKSLVNDSQNKQSMLLKACRDALQHSSFGSGSDSEHWFFSMHLDKKNITLVTSVIKKYNLTQT